MTQFGKIRQYYWLEIVLILERKGSLFFISLYGKSTVKFHWEIFFVILSKSFVDRYFELESNFIYVGSLCPIMSVSPWDKAQDFKRESNHGDQF